jgi:hypothetical protein
MVSQRSGSTVVSRLVVLVVAVLAAVVIWGVAKASGVAIESPGYGASSPVQAIELVWIIAVPAIMVLAGWGLLVLLRRLLPTSGSRVWTVIAAVVLLLSLTVPVTGTGVTVGDRVTLLALHIVVGLVVIVGLTRRNRPV